METESKKPKKYYFCKKANSPANLDFERTSWSGDMLEVCEYCRISPWDKKFEESHSINETLSKECTQNSIVIQSTQN